MKDYKKKRPTVQQQDGYQLDEETLEEKPHKHKKKKSSGTKKLDPSLSQSNSPSPSLDQTSPSKWDWKQTTLKLQILEGT